MKQKIQSYKVQQVIDKFCIIKDVLYALANSIVRNPDDAEDIMQNVAMKAAAHAEELKEDGINSWLYTVTRFSAIDYTRKRLRDRRILEETGYLARPLHSPEELAIRNEISDIVNGEAERLPPEQREVMEMFYLEGIRIDEMGRRQNVPLNTIKTRLRYARKKLLAAVQE